MKKFTKVSLITALVTFIIGCLICGVGALLGGFRQLEGLNIRAVTGIPFRFFRAIDGGYEYGFYDGDWDDLEEWDAEWEVHKDWERMNMKDGDRVQLTFTKDTLRNLDISLGACEFVVEESEDERAWLVTSGNMEHFRYHEEGDTLYLVRKQNYHFWNWIEERKRNNLAKVWLYLPKGTNFDNVEINFGAGVMDSMELHAHEARITIGAGLCRIAGLVSDGYTDINVGAGQVRLKSFEVKKADMVIGAGELYVEDARITEDAELEIGMGNVEVCGMIAGDLTAEIGMGNLTLRMDDAEEDHNYEIECSMGNVNLGGMSYTGLAKEKEIFNGSGSTFDIECSMGNVSVSFAH